MKSPLRPVTFGFAVAVLLTASSSYADKAWDQYLGLNPAQKSQLKAADEAKKSEDNPAKQDKDSTIQNLMSQVLANAGDPAVTPLLSQVLGDIKTINGAEDTFWSAIRGFLTPTQTAKIYLKRHQPKNPPQAPPSIPNQGNAQPKYNWNAYFGFSKDMQSQLKAADQAKNTQMKSLKEEKEGVLSQINQLVQTTAPDSAIQPPLGTLFADIQAEHTAEQTYWETTLTGFLNPTQEAKLFLRRHAPKGTFNPPPPTQTP